MLSTTTTVTYTPKFDAPNCPKVHQCGKVGETEHSNTQDILLTLFGTHRRMHACMNTTEIMPVVTLHGGGIKIPVLKPDKIAMFSLKVYQNVTRQL